jgi:hypothetical protein
VSFTVTFRSNCTDFGALVTGHLQPRQPGEGEEEEEEEGDYPDECYLDCAFQPLGNFVDQIHPGLTDVDLTANKLLEIPVSFLQ